MRAVPLEYGYEDGQLAPRDPELARKVREYCVQELGAVEDFVKGDRVYVVLDEQDAVVGLGTARPKWDVPLFHVTRPEDLHDEAQRNKAVAARDALYARLRAYIEDTSGRGGTALVRVDRQAVRLWQSFLQEIQAQPADRFEVPI